MIERMTADEYRALHKAQKREGRVKGAVRTLVGDRVFDSALEARRYAQLMHMQKAGLIADLKCQVPIALRDEAGPVLTPSGRQMHYVADFAYRETASGAEIIEDAKGYRTEQYRMKRAVLAAMGFEIREVERAKKRGQVK